MKINLFIAGAQKSGTTALSHFLSQVPCIKVFEEKELHIFDSVDYSEDIAVQKTKSVEKNRYKYILDATPIYMFRVEFIERMYRYNKNSKIIVILKDPVERAISQYNMEKFRGNEKLPLAMAIILEPLRLRLLSLLSKSYKDKAMRHFSYCERSKYHKQIQNLEEYYSGKILVLSSTALMDSHNKTMFNVLKFLNIESSKIPKHEVVFKGEKNRVSKLSYFLIKYRLRNDTKYFDDLFTV